MTLAIIGGSGLTQLASLGMTRRKAVRTPYGEPSGALTFGRLRDREVIFLARHGYGHTIPPHEVNYRANIWALREGGAPDRVGRLRRRDRADLGRALVVPQVIDYTWGVARPFSRG
jgi:5'-methylthioadenosine phosphorylase